jgi:hypothetical protein
LNNSFRLDATSLYSACDPSTLDFETTPEIVDGPEIIGQPRAVEAVEFGVQLRGEGYNIFALGPEGVGRRSLSSITCNWLRASVRSRTMSATSTTSGSPTSRGC